MAITQCPHRGGCSSLHVNSGCTVRRGCTSRLTNFKTVFISNVSESDLVTENIALKKLYSSTDGKQSMRRVPREILFLKFWSTYSFCRSSALKKHQKSSYRFLSTWLVIAIVLTSIGYKRALLHCSRAEELL